MARIRSLHPGQWTDENFVSVGPFARLLTLGLRNEADDQGVFEWKPVGLKMRLFPADNVDVAALLDELVAANHIRRFEIGGKAYGAIRNFRKWQRPEKPKTTHPIADDLLEYVGLSPKEAAPDDTNRRPVADQSPKVSAEEGGRRKEEGEKKETTPRPAHDPEAAARDARVRVVAAALGLSTDPLKWPPMWVGLGAGVDTWVRAGLDLKTHILPACAEFLKAPPNSGKPVAYLGGIVKRVATDAPAKSFSLSPAGPDPRIPESDFKAKRRLETWRDEPHLWNRDAWGPTPDEPGCLITPDQIAALTRKAA